MVSGEQDPYVELARAVIESYVRDGKVLDISDAPDELKRDRAGVFVSLKKHGELRGCIGTIQPTTTNIAEEIRNNAISSASADPRFPPVDASELEALDYSVDVLGEPEDIPDISYLNPDQYGVIVRSGPKTGLLLPDLEGVDTPEQQLRIASMKAGILPGEKVTLQRFKVIRHR